MGARAQQHTQQVTVKHLYKEELKKSNTGRDAALDIKGSVFTLTVLCLKSADTAAIDHLLSEHLSLAPRFFHNAPIVLDVKALANDALDFAALVTLLRKYRLVPVGVRHATPEQQNLAIAAGLAVLQGGSKADLPAFPAETRTPSNPATAPHTTAPAAQAPEARVMSAAAKIVHQPVRSGQQVYAKGSDLILLAPVNAGAEVLADGNIHIYAPLRGRALAGVNGDTHARVFTQSLEAELVSIAGQYRIFEQQPAADVHGKPVQIYLDGERLIITPLI